MGVAAVFAAEEVPGFATRGFGAAAAAGIACAKSILAGGRVPQWSTGIGNVASQKTAARVGFFKLADVLTATLGE